MFGFDYEYLVAHSKNKFWRFFGQKLKKQSVVKHSIGKPFSLNFVNLLPTFCPILFKETDRYFELDLDTLIIFYFNLFFLKILVFQKSPSLLKLIFKATQLQKIPEYDNFPKKVFCNLALGMNLGINAVPVWSGKYLWRDSTSLY